ncbi:MAG: hypothetical protein LBN11_02195, partial [Tannerella sp.]|nr:hypothetical protein [Tannerella sp.]
MKFIFTILFFFTVTVPLFCQDKGLRVHSEYSNDSTGKQLSDFNNYEIVEKSPLGFLPKDSKNLPILVQIEGSEKYFSELYSNTKYLNATVKEQRDMEA